MPSGYVFLYSFIILYDNSWEYIRLYIHIGVGSALLVSMSWAMREPPSVRRVTGTGSHAYSSIVGFAELGEHIGKTWFTNL